MANESVSVTYTPEFKRNLRQLSKKYRHIREDLQPLLDELVAGSTPGDQIRGVQDVVFKARVSNSDARKGKSGGYRVIYHVKQDEAVVLITIYSKAEQSDVAAVEIRRILAAHEASQSGEPGDEGGAS